MGECSLSDYKYPSFPSKYHLVFRIPKFSRCRESQYHLAWFRQKVFPHSILKRCEGRIFFILFFSIRSSKIKLSYIQKVPKGIICLPNTFMISSFSILSTPVHCSVMLCGELAGFSFLLVFNITYFWHPCLKSPKNILSWNKFLKSHIISPPPKVGVGCGGGDRVVFSGPSAKRPCQVEERLILIIFSTQVAEGTLGTLSFV